MVEVQKSKQVHQSKRMNASCFSNDLHNGRIAASWNPANLEIMNLKGGRQGSIRITTAVTGFDRDIYIPSWPPIEINPPPTNGNGNGGEWGGIGAVIGGGAYVDMRAPDSEKDCGEDSTTPPFLGYICPYAKYYYYAYQEQDDYYSHASTNMCPPHAPFLICYGVYEDEDGNRERDHNCFINECPSYYLPKEVVINGKTWRLVDKDCFCSALVII